MNGRLRMGIVEIDAVSPDSANRVMNLLGGAHNGPRTGDEPLRIETIYDAARARLKIILVGGMDTNASYFGIISAALEA